MSHEASTWAWGRDELKPGPKFVLVALANFADQEHSCFPGVALLARRTGMGESTVKEHIAYLREHGYISSEPRGKRGGGRRSNRYWLGVDGLFTNSPNSGPLGGGANVQISDTNSPDSGPSIEEEPSVVTVSVDADASTSKAIEKPRADVEALCRTLAERITQNGVRKTATTITAQWRDAARLLLDRDKVPLNEALRVLHWSQSDEFWRANILSMPTFRKQYDRLRLAAERPVVQNRPTNAEQGLDLVRRMREEASRGQGGDRRAVDGGERH